MAMLMDHGVGKPPGTMVILRRALHDHASTTLQPSQMIRRASPRIASILSSYGRGGGPRGSNHATSGDRRDRGPPRANAASNAGSVPPDEWDRWTTPGMPILTARQLELSLLEIRRRRRTKRARQSTATAKNSATHSEAAILVPLCTVRGTPSILFTRRSAGLSSHASQISFPGGYCDEKLDFEDVGGGGPRKNRLVNAAVREMREELRYDIHQLGFSNHVEYHDECNDANDAATTNNLPNNQQPFVTILGQTQPVPSMTGSRVTPVIGAINRDLPDWDSPQFKAMFPGNPEEVDWIFTVPVRDLMAGETSAPLRRWSAADDSDENAGGGTTGAREHRGPVFPVPDGDEKREGDRIWGLTAIVLRPLLRRVFGPAFEGDGLGSIGSVAKL